MQKKVESLRERIRQNAVIQEDDSPHEEPNVLIEESFKVLEELESLVFKINEANLKNKLADGRSITEAIARKDTLKAQHSLITHSITSARREPDRYSMTEIKWVSTLDIAELQKRSDELAKEIRVLNVEIQETNWTAELKE